MSAPIPNANSKNPKDLALNNPINVLHTQFFRLMRILAINAEIYRQLRALMPDALHARDYVAGMKKLYQRFRHSYEFYRNMMLLQLEFQKKVQTSTVLMHLFNLNQHAITDLKDLETNVFYKPFAAPMFSIYNPHSTLHKGLPNLMTGKTTQQILTNHKLAQSIYGMRPFLQEYIFANEAQTILKQMKLPENISISTRQRGGDVSGIIQDGGFFNLPGLQGIFDQAIPTPQVMNGQSTITYDDNIVYKVHETANAFLHLVNDYCTAKKIPYASHECQNLVQTGLHQFRNNVCNSRDISKCLDNVLNNFASTPAESGYDAHVAEIPDIAKATGPNMSAEFNEQFASIVAALNGLSAKIESMPRSHDNSADFAEIKQAINDKVAKSQQLDAIMMRLSSEHAKLQGDHETLIAELKRLQASNAEHSTVQQVEEGIDMLSQYLREIQQKLSESQAAKSSLDGDVADLQLQIANKDTALQKCNQNVVDQDNHISKLNIEIGNSRTTIVKCNKNVKDQDKHISAKNYELAEKDAIIADLRKNIAAKDATLESNGSELTTKNRELNYENTQLKETEIELRSQIASSLDEIAILLARKNDQDVEALKAIEDVATLHLSGINAAQSVIHTDAQAILDKMRGKSSTQLAVINSTHTIDPEVAAAAHARATRNAANTAVQARDVEYKNRKYEHPGISLNSLPLHIQEDIINRQNNQTVGQDKPTVNQDELLALTN